MPRKELLLFATLLLLGSLDWLTTLTGLAFYGASETNPMLAGLAGSNTTFFSAIKLAAVILTGTALYKATTLISKPEAKEWQLTKHFLTGGTTLTTLMLAAVVANNIIVLIIQ